MEFVASETGQSLQLIHMDEIRPLRGGIFLPALNAEIVNRYQFQSVPNQSALSQSTQPQPIKYETGVMQARGVAVAIASVEIYNDGVIVNTRSDTKDADAVLDDFIPWMINRFSLRQPKAWLRRRYYSRIIVDMGNSLGDILITNFLAIKDILTKPLELKQNMDVQLSFGPNSPGELPYAHTWTIQPRIGQPYVENRYFSSAPLSTDEHIEMLRELEAVARKRRK